MKLDLTRREATAWIDAELALVANGADRAERLRLTRDKLALCQQVDVARLVPNAIDACNKLIAKLEPTTIR